MPSFPKTVPLRLEGEAMGLLRLERLQIDKGRCYYCHSLVSDALEENHPLHYDLMHIRHHSVGGSDVVSNVRVGCHECHMKSHNGSLPSLLSLQKQGRL